MKKKIGKYYSGSVKLKLQIRDGVGGEYYNDPPTISVGADHNTWWLIVNTLLHEVLEYNLSKLDCRHQSTEHLGRDHGDYLFIMNHPQYTEAVARSADFIAACLPDLSKAWRKYHRP